MTARDPGHAGGGQTYAPPAQRCACGCGEGVHNIGVRRGNRVRTGCSTGGCGCRLYVPAGVVGAAPAGPLDLDAILDRARRLAVALADPGAPTSGLLLPALASAADVAPLVDALLDLHGRYWPVDAGPAAVTGAGESGG